MIYGKLSDVINYKNLDPKLQSKCNFLKDTDFSQYGPGRHEIEEDLFFFVNEYETKEVEECFWEAHRKYLDFHFILEGTEKIAVDHIERQKVKEDYNEEKDAIFFNGDVHSVVTMRPGDVMICYPEDSHMTAILAGKKEKVRKIVLKVKL